MHGRTARSAVPVALAGLVVLANLVFLARAAWDV